ncbi:MAG: hypothetical protein HWE39_15735, partial [Oceanospirillaceae bacterium]|nr:hypothetical protein [Oceanospirillaceae bacterium]
MPIYYGTDNDDTIVGDTSSDTLNGLAGDDVLTGGGSATRINGGDGQDTITGGGSSNRLYGGNNSDVILGGGSSNYLYGEAGDDLLTAGGISNVLYGGSGDDTLQSGTENNATLYGAEGDDLFAIQWSNATSNNTFYTYVYDSSGDDILDISDIADSLDNVRFGNNYYGDLNILIYDDDGNRIGSILVDNQFSSYYGNIIETLVVGDVTIDLTNYESAMALNSAFVYGATEGDDNLSGLGSNDTIFGLGGNDTITLIDEYSDAFGGDGDDQLIAGGYANYLQGNSGADSLYTGDNDSIVMNGSQGDDVYFIEWESASSDDTYVAQIGTYSQSSDGDDTLDLSAIAATLDDISFQAYSYGSGLSIVIYEDGETIGNVNILNQFSSGGYYGDTIETIILGDETIDISGYSHIGALNSALIYGAGSGDDVITGTTAEEILVGFEGDDTISAGGTSNTLSGNAGNDILITEYNNTSLYGGNGEDTYTISWDGPTTNNQFYAYIHDSNDSTNGSNGDIIDLSDVADSLSDLRFSGTSSQLLISVLDDDGEIIGSVTVANQYYNNYSYDEIETLIVGDDTLDLTAYANGAELNSIVTYGVSNDDDTVTTDENSATLYALDGDDFIYTTGSNNHIYGANGNDTIELHGSSSYGYGENGNDLIVASGSYSNLVGGEGNDTLIGKGSSITLQGGEGNDTLRVEGSSALAYGGAGDDVYQIAWQNANPNNTQYTYINDYAYSTDTGNDRLDLSDIADDLSYIRFEYGYYSDLLIYVENDSGETIGQITLNNHFYSSYQNYTNYTIETLFINGLTFDLSEATSETELNDSLSQLVSDTDDLLAGTNAADVIFGYGGNDTISGGVGEDLLRGGKGDDSINGDGGSDTLVGGNGSDTLNGGALGDFLEGGDGKDVLDGGAGSDRLFGGTHNDEINAGDGNDVIFGDHGADTIDGGDGTDAVQYLASGTGVTVDLSTGLGTSGQATGDVLSNIENINGSRASDHLIGDD